MEKDNKLNNIYLYKTVEYSKMLEESTISTEKAINIVCQSEEYKPFLQHYLVYKDEFIFTSLPPTHAGTIKLGEGLKVNRHTGELTKINRDTYPNVYIQIGNSIAVKCK